MARPLPLLLTGLVLLCVVGAVWLLPPDTPVDPAPPERLGRFPRSQFFLEHDLFLSVTDPKTVAAAEARHVRPEDEVFGVVVGGRARAYPIYMIAYHHVVNDVIRGIPVAVTY